MEEIDRVRTAGVRFGCVLADAVYGSGGAFRQSLSARGLKWAVGLSRRQTVYPAETGLIFPEAGRGRRRKYYASNLPADTTLKALASAINARWICEQRHQKLTEELGLDHFEGRSWTGLHRHALITMIAYAFLQSRRLKAAGREKQNPRSTPQPTMPAIRQAILNILQRPPPTRCPHCERLILEPINHDLPKSS